MSVRLRLIGTMAELHAVLAWLDAMPGFVGTVEHAEPTEILLGGLRVRVVLETARILRTENTTDTHSDQHRPEFRVTRELAPGCRDVP